MFFYMSSIRKNIQICVDFLIYNGNACSSLNPVFLLQNIIYPCKNSFQLNDEELQTWDAKLKKKENKYVIVNYNLGEW